MCVMDQTTLSYTGKVYNIKIHLKKRLKFWWSNKIYHFCFLSGPDLGVSVGSSSLKYTYPGHTWDYIKAHRKDKQWSVIPYTYNHGRESVNVRVIILVRLLNYIEHNRH